jgi:hypothetical protein
MKDKLLSGEKRHTIRRYNRKRAHQIAKIKKLQIYWKLRTKYTEKLFDAELVKMTYIHLDDHGYPWSWVGDRDNPFSCNIGADCDLVKFPREEADNLAKKDGFDSIEEMQTWFTAKYGNNVSGDYMGISFERVKEDTV